MRKKNMKKTIQVKSKKANTSSRKYIRTLSLGEPTTDTKFHKIYNYKSSFISFNFETLDSKKILHQWPGIS